MHADIETCNSDSPRRQHRQHECTGIMGKTNEADFGILIAVPPDISIRQTSIIHTEFPAVYIKRVFEYYYKSLLLQIVIICFIA